QEQRRVAASTAQTIAALAPHTGARVSPFQTQLISGTRHALRDRDRKGGLHGNDDESRCISYRRSHPQRRIPGSSLTRSRWRTSRPPPICSRPSARRDEGGDPALTAAATRGASSPGPRVSGSSPPLGSLARLPPAHRRSSTRAGSLPARPAPADPF